MWGQIIPTSHTYAVVSLPGTLGARLTLGSNREQPSWGLCHLWALGSTMEAFEIQTMVESVGVLCKSQNIQRLGLLKGTLLRWMYSFTCTLVCIFLIANIQQWIYSCGRAKLASETLLLFWLWLCFGWDNLFNSEWQASLQILLHEEPCCGKVLTDVLVLWKKGTWSFRLLTFSQSGSIWRV